MKDGHDRTRHDGRPLLDRAFAERMRTSDLEPCYGHSPWMDWACAHLRCAIQGQKDQCVIVERPLRRVDVRLGRCRNKEDEGPDGCTPAEVCRFVDPAVALAAG